MCNPNTTLMDPYRLKINLLGQVQGKTKIVEMYSNTSVRRNLETEIGAAFVDTQKIIDNHEVNLQIWDMVGQDMFKSVRSRYYYGSMGGIIFYDINVQESFRKIAHWIQELWQNCGRGPVPVVIMGIEEEKRDNDSIPIEKAQDFVNKLNEKLDKYDFKVHHFEGSSITGQNVTEVFEELGRQIIRGLDAGQIQLR